MESHGKCRAIIAALVLLPMLCHIGIAVSATISTVSEAISIDTGPLPEQIVTGNSVETCLNSRYSQHSLSGTASDQQISNILWAAGKAPFTGTQRDIYIATPTGTYLYDMNSHSLSFHSNDVRDDGAFAIIYGSQLDFDTGVSFMPALLASVSLCNSTESPVASCPKGIGYPKARLIFGVQSGRGLTTNLAVHCSVAEGQPGWLPDPCTTSDNSIEEVLANLNYVNSFGKTNLTLQQISQILWAGYGCTDHTPSGKAGLTVPSAWAIYYLTRSIYLANENGVYRYHNRNPGTDLTTWDHRIEQINSADVRGGLQSAVSGLPQAPCYVILCLDSSYLGQEYAHLETGFVAGNMLIQATAIGLGCHFKTELTPVERSSIQATTAIPSAHVPQVIVSIGLIEDPIVDFSGDGIVNFKDYCILAQYWLQFESSVDIAPPPYGDDKVDWKDAAIFVDGWLTATTIPPLPEQAGNPNPSDVATDVNTTTNLSWTSGSGATSHDVYFGMTNPPPFIGNQVATTFVPGTMYYNATYYWRIDEVNGWGKTKGIVWSFTTTTIPPPPPP
ncbi:MAG: nitroreductase family protein [Phycisphaerae bacterium]|nr:nitroreductase family protein [Phycisphaerae bacterium]